MHWNDPDCPPTSWVRAQEKERTPVRGPRPPSRKFVRYMRERYKNGAGEMQPLAVTCDVMDNVKTRAATKLDAARLAHEIVHGKIAPAQAVAAVQVNQQVVQAGTTEGQPSGQLTPGDRARHLAGLLKATAVLGDVCPSPAAGGGDTPPGEPAASGAAAGGDGSGGGRGAGS